MLRRTVLLAMQVNHQMSIPNQLVRSSKVGFNTRKASELRTQMTQSSNYQNRVHTQIYKYTPGDGCVAIKKRQFVFAFEVRSAVLEVASSQQQRRRRYENLVNVRVRSPSGGVRELRECVCV
jgi:predicted TIM-barrel fold metal-dependent hydrolase